VIYERLTAADAAFLHIETPHEPQHVGSLSVLDGAPLRDRTGRIRFEEIREHIGGRLHRVPRLRQRLMTVPYGQGRPVWVDDDAFDIDFHVRLTSLPRPGSDEQLSVLMGRLQSQALDRRRPLWEIWLVDGLAGDEVGMIIKTHHAMGDGIASVDMALALVDIEPSPVEESAPPEWAPRPAPSPNQLLLDSIWDQMSQPTKLARAAFDVARNPRPLIRTATNLIRTTTEFMVKPQPAPWNVPVSPYRRWVHADIDMESVRQVREHRTVTINDVVLAACSGALRSFLLEHGAGVDDRVLKAMVPVSLRKDDEHGDTLGNRVSMMLLELPVDESEPRARLAQVHARSAKLKDAGLVDGAETLVKLVDGIPSLAATLTRLVSRRIPMNLVITNVPGPPVPLYLLGSRILRSYPYVEVIDDEGLTIAVISYDDHMFFGITSDRDVIPDLGTVAEGIEKEFLALADSVVSSP
jgi:diacylglycerol O-acyltransferase